MSANMFLLHMGEASEEEKEIMFGVKQGTKIRLHQHLSAGH